jgi:hypothetical protein
MMKRVKIKYDKSSKSIFIDDDLKLTYSLLSILFIINLTTSIIEIYKIKLAEIELFDYLWFAIGIISIIALIYQFLKKSTSNKIKLAEIKLLKIKKIYGSERFSLHLTNGKQRDLMVWKNGANIKEIKEIIGKFGIEIVEKNKIGE